MVPTIKSEVTVRVILLNERNELLLQKVEIPGKPPFYITPGGRLDRTDSNLVSAVRRELVEETGIPTDRLIMDDSALFYTGVHTMTKKNEPVKMTENFFLVRVAGESEIDTSKQALTAEEALVLKNQSWFSLADLDSSGIIVVPVNLSAILRALLSSEAPPPVDFRDPPEFRFRNLDKAAFVSGLSSFLRKRMVNNNKSRVLQLKVMTFFVLG